MNFIFQLALLVISYYVSAALAPKPPQPKPAALEDFDIPLAEEGRAIPVVFGTVVINSPSVMWYGDLRSTPIKEKGGKK
jgi:hypothetical protein